ncbi:F0F1 ATP synthase subunit alpha [Sorangium sp. So ce281]|uniref:F0F1 ATP synthase subunit alpha n=1 Tax=unclassified Sorangium TaxID=2621164 RepID=UPI003F637B6A
MGLAEDLGGWAGRARESARGLPLGPEAREVGRVLRVADGIAAVSGLPSAKLDEVLVFEDGTRGLAVALDPGTIGCVLLGPDRGIAAGSAVQGTGTVIDVPVGEALLGRVVDPLGVPIDGGGPLGGAAVYHARARARAPIERRAPSIVDRDPVAEPLFTGILLIDAMLPLGRGQRELIIGDRGTGKTAIAVDAILSQRETDVVCIYAAIGQTSSSVGAVIDAVRRYGPKNRTTCVVAAPDATAGLQWLTPYAACSMAEHFVERGGHALLVLDDLTSHALVHRQISLLLRQPPGREAFPGDVFYLHSRLLERAAKLTGALGGGSLTMLPIAETQASNLSAYIPTNLISITDGQIFLDPRLYNEGWKPAIDVGKSVSRVGGKTQTPAMRAVAESLRLEYAQFLELELFARVGGGAEEATKRALERGRRARAAMAQPLHRPLPVGRQIALLMALQEGLLDPLPVAAIDALREALDRGLPSRCPATLARLEAGVEPAPEERRALLAELAAMVAEVGARGDEGRGDGRG